MIDCPICHVKNEDDARFCAECGQRLTGGAAQQSMPPAGSSLPRQPESSPPVPDQSAGRPRLHSPLLASGETQPDVKDSSSGDVNRLRQMSGRANSERPSPSPAGADTPYRNPFDPRNNLPPEETQQRPEGSMPPRQRGKGLRSPLLASEEFDEDEFPQESDTPPQGRGGGHLRSPLLGGGSSSSWQDDPPSENPSGHTPHLRSPLLGSSEGDYSGADRRGKSTFPPENYTGSERRRSGLRSPILGGGDESDYDLDSAGDEDEGDPYADEGNPNILRSPLLAAKRPLSADRGPSQPKTQQTPQTQGPPDQHLSQGYNLARQEISQSYPGRNVDYQGQPGYPAASIPSGQNDTVPGAGKAMGAIPPAPGGQPTGQQPPYGQSPGQPAPPASIAQPGPYPPQGAAQPPSTYTSSHQIPGNSQLAPAGSYESLPQEYQPYSTGFDSRGNQQVQANVAASSSAPQQFASQAYGQQAGGSSIPASSRDFPAKNPASSTPSVSPSFGNYSQAAGESAPLTPPSTQPASAAPAAHGFARENLEQPGNKGRSRMLSGYASDEGEDDDTPSLRSPGRFAAEAQAAPASPVLKLIGCAAIFFLLVKLYALMGFMPTDWFKFQPFVIDQLAGVGTLICLVVVCFAPRN